MMLGMNAPKAVAKGEYAKAIRKAIRESMVTKEKWTEPIKKSPWKVKFVTK